MPAPPTGAILWLHDLGERDSGGFASVAGPHLPWLNINSPAATPRVLGCRPKKPGGLPAWFDVEELPISVESLESQAVAPPDGLTDSVKIVHERLDYLQKVLSIDATRIVVGGFGQGGALAIAAALAYHKRVAGILSHSGWVCQSREELTNVAAITRNAETPLMLIQGIDDDKVDHAAALASAEMLRAAGFKVILKSFEGQEHKMSEQTLNLSVDFLRAQLPISFQAPKKQCPFRTRSISREN